ncbi:MAG TPA: DUF1028 domain-containing protein, partial [Anaerolineales bacterium]|nr:DUF1028 domain-containing protein [Anaerolineales bacterium]
CLRPVATFSIVAWDASLPAWGIAVASKFPAVGAVVPWARAGAGAVATQSYANTTFGPEGLRRMASGEPAESVLQALLRDDPGREERQAGFVDARGAAATFTGAKCQAWAGGWIGDGVAIQGNILAGPQVVEAMAQAFGAAAQDLPHRLLAALLAGDRAGGDRRGRQSAALLVVREGGGYAGHNDRWIDYRVDDHSDPVPRLIELLELHELYFGISPPEDRVALEGDDLARLLEEARRLGYYDGPVTSSLSTEARSALRTFIGNENFEDRCDLEAGWIDRPAFAFLLERSLR